MLIEKNGLKLYTDTTNKISEASITNFSDEIKAELQLYNLNKLTVDSTDCIDDFSVIVRLKTLSSLIIRFDYKTIDISFVNEMPNLKELGSPKFIGSITNKNITSIGYKWHKKSDISQCSNLQSIDIHNCSDLASFFKQIDNLQFLKRVSFFRLTASSIPLCRLNTNIEELTFSYCPKLQTLDNLGNTLPKVTKMTIENCKNVCNYEALSEFKDLQKLSIFDSSPISDISFLTNLKKLTHIRIGKTQITAKNKDFLNNIKNVDLCMTGI